MGRTLPWLVHKSSAATSSLTNTKRDVPGARHSKRPKLEQDARNEAYSSTSSAAHQRDKRAADPDRKQDDYLPSSPPPSLLEPVATELMRNGLQADDIYMMVEDEFYDVARTFTAHVHQEEYERLRTQARERHAAATTNIVRPIDGRTALPAQAKRAKERQAAILHRDEKLGDRHASGLAGNTSDGDGEGNKDTRGWAGTTLGGLLSTPSKTHKSLVGVHGPAVDTRAAAGYKQAQLTPSKQRQVHKPVMNLMDSDTGSEDDLDASPGAFVRKSGPRARPASSGTKIRSHAKARPNTNHESLSRPDRADPWLQHNNTSASTIERSDDHLHKKHEPSVKMSVTTLEDDFDTFPRTRPLPPGRKPLKSKEGKEKQRKPDFVEIPLYLE